MVAFKPKIFPGFPIVAVLLLAFGLGLFVVSTQQKQDNRSRASTSPNTSECNTQVSGKRCCSVTYPGAMCMYDNTGQACAGGFINTTSSYTTWYCPGGNHYRCCFNAQPSVSAGGDKTITLPTNSVTLSGSCSDADRDSRNLKSCVWSKESGPSGGSISSPNSGSTSVTGLQQGTYVYRLTATDGYATKTDTASVTVNAAANKPPVANAGPDQTITLPTNSVTLTGSGTDSDGTIASYNWTKTGGPSAGTITNVGSASTTLTGLVQGTYKFMLKVTDDKGATHTDEVQVTVSPSLATTFTFDLLFHGIGKGGDNRNPNGGGNPDPKHPTRTVVIDVYDLDDQPIIANKQGDVTFDPVSGSYKGSIAMGSTLTSQSYVIKVKLSHSLRGSISRNIVGGTTNAIPVIKLVNGDTNNDAKLDIEDYNIILGCYSDFDLPAADCNVTKRAQADIDDDGNVNQFDMNLFLREMSVQQL
jgi:hypothetical protein